MSSSDKSMGHLQAAGSGTVPNFLNQLRVTGLWWCWVAVAVFVADQVTKHMILDSFRLGQVEPITGFFNLVFVLNPGAAWSFLADAGGWQRWFFTGVSIFASVLIMGWLYTLPKTERWTSVSLVMILGGALGNLYDRVVYGAVVDFLDFHWSGYHFPAFNVADAAITIGAVMMIIDMFFLQSQPND